MNGLTNHSECDHSLCWVEIDLEQVERNVRELVRFAAGTPLLIVVKGDAYGHGLLPVARKALAAGARFLGVTGVDEGRALRRDGILAPILLLQPPLPEQIPYVLGENLRVTVTNAQEAEVLSEWARRNGRMAVVHIKVDTGMGRFGASVDQAQHLLERVQSLPELHLEGVFSHLSCADEPGHPFTAEQVHTFERIRRTLRKVSPHQLVFHLANSAGFLNYPDIRFDLCRVGLSAYGIYPVPAKPDGPRHVHWPELAPAMSLYARVVAVREVAKGTPIGYGATYRTRSHTRVAVLAAGYADGVSRKLSNRGRALIGGRSFPIVGRVCMNQLMVELSPDSSVAVGAEAVLLGRQGDEVITVEEWCRSLETIPHDVLCSVGRVRPRVYRSRPF